MLSLPELAAAEVLSQYSTALYIVLAIVHLYIQSLSPPFGHHFTCMMFRPIQERLQIQIVTVWQLFGCLHGQLYCKIILSFLLL